MALTALQKNRLDEILREKLPELAGRPAFSPSEIVDILKEEVDFDFTYRSIPSCIDRVFANIKDYHVSYGYGGEYYITIEIRLKKEKNLLYFCGTPENVYYNFADGSFSAESPLLDTKKFEAIKTLLPYEWIFNYCTDTNELKNIAKLGKGYYEKMPTGLYNYLEEKGYILTARTLRDYVLHQKYGKYAFFYKSIEELIGDVKTDKLVDKIKIENLYKLFNNSLLKGELLDLQHYTIRESLDTIYTGVCDCGCAIDTNRGIVDNEQCINSFLDKNRTAIIEKNMKKLNFINGLEIDDYVVVVPQTMEDKAAEGRMQHNCVGYYYDNSIMGSRNAIYFLRKKENPEHSYITCRYNYYDKNTVEARKVNNSDIRNNKEQQIIKDISDIITEYFANHKE
jgi:hypothetical protein